MANASSETEPTSGEPSLVRAAHWLNDHLPRLLSAVGTLGIAACGIWFSVKGKDAHWCAWLVAIVTAIVWIIGEIWGWCRGERLSTLKQQLERSEDSRKGLEGVIERTSRDYFDLFQDQLSLLANDVFGFTDKERISVYKHDGTAFVMLGRYSKNPGFCKKGRTIYPDNEGCIAAAWKDGESVIQDLPDPDMDSEGYASQHKTNWNINKQTTKGFRMKSRSYVAIAIEDRHQKRIAVAVFESIKANSALDKDKINSLLASHEGKRIAQFLDRMKALEPSPSYAHEEGF